MVAPLVRSQAQLAADGANWNTQIQGVTPPYMIARDLTIQRHVQQSGLRGPRPLHY